MNENIERFLEIVPDLHSTSCGLKAFCTWWGTEVLEMCRRSMGGHAFSSFSSIPRLIADYAVMTTGGGIHLSIYLSINHIYLSFDINQMKEII